MTTLTARETDSPLDRIMAGLNEALAHAMGEPVPGMIIHKVWYDEAGDPHIKRIDPTDFYITDNEKDPTPI